MSDGAGAARPLGLPTGWRALVGAWLWLQERPAAMGGAGLVLGAGVCGWAGLFGWLALVRHLSGGTHAEDLGFTDQVLWNMAHGRWFRMSLYQGATWNTEIEVARLARPDSLLAFHVEPMLLLLAPLYAMGGDARHLLVLQALAVALGAIPAYRLAARWAGSSMAGLAVAAAYLLSPLGQWAALADFHTSALAAPLLLLTVERLAARRARAGVLAALLAMTAREDVAPAVAALGLVAAWAGQRRAGLLLAALGIGWSLAALAVGRAYSGGVSPFAVRYAAALDGPSSVLAALARLLVGQYATTVLLSGGWLALLSPLALLPALPALAANALSSSPWMASGKAHYSVLALPFVTAAAAAGLGRLRGRTGGRGDGETGGVGERESGRAGNRGAGAWRVRVACAGLVATSGLAYLTAGAGPLGGDYAPASVTEHDRIAAVLAHAIPRETGVSASSSLVPRVSRRERVYVFPAVEDADYVFVDVTASPAPTSAGDVYLRVRSLLGGGG
jgi:uncharacterized membrane protein